MTAGEDHPQRVIVKLIGEAQGVRIVLRWRICTGLVGQLLQFVLQRRVPAQGIDRPVACDSRDPRGRVVRGPLEGPTSYCGYECILHDVFGQVDVRGSKGTHKVRHQAPGLVSKQVVDKLWDRSGQLLLTVERADLDRPVVEVRAVLAHRYSIVVALSVDQEKSTENFFGF